MAIKQYSLRVDGAKQLAPGFTVREFRCRDGTDTVMIDEGLVVLLQCIREHFGKPVTITSGYRTASHNAKVGGSKSSQHLLGRAADIQVQDTDPLAVQVSSLNPLKDKGVAMAYVVIVLCVLFAALFKSCGYIACAFVLSMAIMYIIGKRMWLQMVLVSLLVPLGMWLIFYKVLTVNIPLGPLNFLRTLVDMI